MIKKNEVLFTKVFFLHIIHLRYQNVFNVVVFESLNKNHIETIVFLFLLTILIKQITHNSDGEFKETGLNKSF